MSDSKRKSTELTNGVRLGLERPKPVGRPHVLAIVLDDTGFAQLGCFGSTIDTPHIDRLAAEGLRFNRFHVTAMCSPTRAAFLTGRNAHRVGMGFVADVPLDFAGYTARIPPSAATLARVLRDAGWATRAVGKWHLVPRYERSDAGPFDHWPLGLGFERYYGFLQGDTSQWYPNLIEDNHSVDVTVPRPGGYHLSEDLVTRAVRDILGVRQASPGKPTFTYLALGAMHAPHHVAPAWSDRYRGAFDMGWDRWRDTVMERQRSIGVVPEQASRSERPPWVLSWEELGADEKRLFARQQEVFAGFLSHTDAQIGRLIDTLDEIGVLDDTVVMLFSDNGASAEGGRLGSRNEHRFTGRVPEDLGDNLGAIDHWGGPEAYSHYSWGWAWAGNAPFRLWKRFTWLGGTRTPLIIRYPAAISDPGSVRSQILHVVDLAPTILDVVGVDPPASVDGVAQMPLDGRSARSILEDPKAPEIRHTQYFELLGSRSIIHDGWKATTDHVPEGLLDEEEFLDGSRSFDEDHWALFNMDDDFAETTDVASAHPEHVQALASLWVEEARANNVLPLFDTLTSRFAALLGPLWPAGQVVELRPDGDPLSDEVLPLLFGGFTMTATVHPGVADGVLAALGDLHGGFSLFIVDGHLHFALADAERVTTIRSPRPVTARSTELAVAYTAADGGALALLCDGDVVAREPYEGTVPVAFQHGGALLRLGSDRGQGVSDLYQAPFELDGTIIKLVIDASPTALASASDLIRAALHSE